MSLLDNIKLQPSLKNIEHCQFDYPEAFVLLLSVAVITLHYQFSPASMALFVIVSLPSLMILIYNYRRQPSFWTSNIVVVLLSTVIGSVQLCTIISLSLALLIGTRVIVSTSGTRIRLLIVSIVTILIFHYVSVTSNGASMNCDESFLSAAILIASITTILWQFWGIYHKYVGYSTVARQAKGRINTMKSIINKLTLFIPPQIWQPIVHSDHAVDIFNKRAKLSIMFSDIVGFTEIFDSLSADNAVDILNTYMSRMTKIANKHSAVLDKFTGDGMICFFGEPDSQGSRQDAINCVAMAIDMRREMRSLRQQWRLMGFAGLYVRIGITTGYCHVGNFGSNSRLSYTVIGKEANLASRLESIAGKDDIFISQTTHNYICHNYECKYVGAFQLKGFDDKVEAWRVLDPNDNGNGLSK